MPQQKNPPWKILEDLARALPDDLLLEKLRAIHDRDVVAAQPAQHPLRRPGDPTEVEFLAALGRGFSDEDRGRWAGSAYCARLLRLHWRGEPPRAELLLRHQRGQLSGFEARAMREHLQEPEGAASVALLTSGGFRSWAERCPQAGGSEKCGRPPAHAWGLLAAEAREGEDVEPGPIVLEAGDQGFLLGTLQQTEDDRLEVSVQSEDPALAGAAALAEVIGPRAALAATLRLGGLPAGRGAFAAHVFEGKFADLAARVGRECTLVVSVAD
jgi:hypothetical protein